MATIERHDDELAQRGDLSWRERMEIVPGQHRPNLVRKGAIFVAGVMIFLWIIYTKPTLPFLGPKGKTLTADFAYGANVRPGYTPVRVHGVDVGQVTSVERAPSGKGVRIKMRIDDGKGVELKQDATLALRWRTLLGRNMFVDVNPGSRSAPALAGGFVPRSRTTDQVELDTALEPLDADGRSALQTTIREFDRGFSSPQAFRNTVGAVEPAMRPLARGMRAFRGSDPGRDLPALVATTSRAMGALARDEVALRGVIDHGQVALGATAARRADLAATLADAPATMQDTRTTLTRLETTLDTLDPLAEKLRPGAAKLDDAARRTQVALTAATPLLRDLRPTLQDLRPAVSDLRDAATAGIPALGPLSSTMDRVRDTFIPFLKSDKTENKRPNYQNIGPAVASVSTATSWGDRQGPVANFEAAAGVNAFIDSPCKVDLTFAKLTQLVQCELFSRALVGAITGKRPQDVKFKDSAVPLSKLKPFLTGRAQLKSNPNLKPLRLRRTK